MRLQFHKLAVCIRLSFCLWTQCIRPPHSQPLPFPTTCLCWLSSYLFTRTRVNFHSMIVYTDIEIQRKNIAVSRKVVFNIHDAFVIREPSSLLLFLIFTATQLQIYRFPVLSQFSFSESAGFSLSGSHNYYGIKHTAFQTPLPTPLHFIPPQSYDERH